MGKSEESRSWRRKVEAGRYLAEPTSLGKVTSRISPSHLELSLPHVLALLYFRHSTPLRQVWTTRSCNDTTLGAVRHEWRSWPPRCHRRRRCFPGRRAERKCVLSNCRCRGGGSDGAAICIRSEFFTNATMCGGDLVGGDATLGRDGL